MTKFECLHADSAKFRRRRLRILWASTFVPLRSMTCAKQEVWCLTPRGLRLAVTVADDLRYLFCTGGPSL
jgi:hypothetical protein